MLEFKDGIWIGMGIGIIIGLVLGISTALGGTTDVVKIEVLNEACHKIYGDNTHWVDNLGGEIKLVCETNQPVIEEEPESDELIILLE